MSKRNQLSRRHVLECAGLSLAGVAGGALGQTPAPDAKALLAVTREGPFKHSIARWCFEKHWDLPRMCQIARQLGCASIELVPPADWPLLKQHGLVCALASSHGFEQGMNNPKYQPASIQKLHAAIDACAAAGFPNVITFTGFREDIPDDVGRAHCVEGYKRIVGYAEQQKVTLCLEMLNSRVREEMKGHPGYQGDHTEYVMDIIRQVGSPRLKLLFDVYHVQIMDGDIISRLRQYREFIGHVHVAGCPGRNELDARQEINFGAVAAALAEIGYTGFVGQEFIPTRDPVASLRQALQTCSV